MSLPLILLLSFTINQAFAYQSPVEIITIKGKVISKDDNLPLPGVSVLEKGTNNRAITDLEGNYEINNVKSNAILVFSYVGFQIKEIPVDNKIRVNAALEISVNTLNETVVVGFGTQKKASLVSSITTISPKDLKGPTSNLTSMLAGRVPGLIAYQRSGEPGLDNSDFFIRGLGSFGTGKQNPLILIDGIESTTNDMARLQPDDIESFSVLKDAAAAAIYGARGANGVVLITSKSGEAGKAKFDFRNENRLSSNARNFQLADNITYMRLANEAALTRNPNAPLPYNQNKIDRTIAGDNELLYPNNNWIDQLIKPYTLNHGYNLSVSGGAEKAKYYVSGTYNIDNGVLKVNGLNNFNSNIKLRNYSIRSNTNLNLTPTTEAIVRVYGQFDDYTGPVGGGQDIFNFALWSNPVKFPAVYTPDFQPYAQHPLFGGAEAGAGGQGLLINPYARMVRGYQEYKSSTIQAQLELKQNFNFITKGLSARAMSYIRRYSYFSVSRQYNPFYYDAFINQENGDVQLSVLNDGGPTSVGTPGTEYLNYSEGNKNLNSRIYLETAINYSRTFNKKHDVSGMLINLLSSFQTGNAGDVQSSLVSRNLGLSGRFTYGYDNKYLAEINFGYNGSERFAEGSRYGFFPSFGLAYRISNEKFFEPLKNVVSDLKFRGTFGFVGNDQIGADSDRFFYLSNVNLNNGTFGATFGDNFGYSRPGISISRYSNPNITWEKSEQINLGMDAEFFGALSVNVDAFRQTRYNILQLRSNLGSTMGLLVTPSTNFGKVESQGLEFASSYNKQFSNNWFVNLRANFTYATNKILQFAENDYPSDLNYLYRRGQPTTRRFGFIAERLFVDDAEVANSPRQFGMVRGGDIKYRDINKDGVISDNDRVPIGHPTAPEIIYGFGGTLRFKSFDISAFLQGSARSSFYINSQNISPFVINGGAQTGLLKAVADNHWSEANRDLYAFFPRLSDTWIENNNQVSTWWLRNGAFLRLKNVELGYNIPEKLTERLKIRNVRLYANALNLAVISGFDLWDPEMGGNGLGYPIQAVYNFGISLRL